MHSNILSALLLVAALWARPLASYSSQTSNVDRYIVILHPAANQQGFLEWVADISNMGTNLHYGRNIEWTYNINNSFKGLSGVFTEDHIIEMKQSKMVKYIEKDQPVWLWGHPVPNTRSFHHQPSYSKNPSVANSERTYRKRYLSSLHVRARRHTKFQSSMKPSPIKSQTSPPSWGLTRTSQRKLDLSEDFHYHSKGGKGVVVYVIDTGVDTRHPDFEGRAVFGKSFIQDWDRRDDVGHGTHVAGVIGGAKHGIAKNVSLVAVKVAAKDRAQLTSARLIAAIDWVAEQYKKRCKRPSVINLSIGSLRFKPTNDAVEAAINAGVHVVTSAGNLYKDACSFSPASVSGAIVVGASNQRDAAWASSNWGPCIDIYAPGESIMSTVPGGGSESWSGTSMAAPFVTGVVASILAERNMPPREMQDLIRKMATKEELQTIGPNTANRLIYNLMETQEEINESPPTGKQRKAAEKIPVEGKCQFYGS